MTDALELPGRVAALVQSTASPASSPLLRARAAIQGDAWAKAVFLEFRAEGRSVEWLRDLIAPRLAGSVDSFDEAVDVAQYLADEYSQLGEGCYVIAPETGRVLLVASEDDFFDPGPLARESGGVAPGLRKLHPTLESAIVSAYHDRGRERVVVERLRARAEQTQLLREEGDARLRVATREGRRSIARELSEDDPWTLLGRVGGTAGMFLRHFELVEEYSGPLSRVVGTAHCRSRFGVQDLTTTNLAYNRLGILRGATAQEWIREIARQLSRRAWETCRGSESIRVEELTRERIATRELWVVDPDIRDLVRRAEGRVLPVEGAEMIGFSGKVGCLVVPHQFGVESREIADCWDVISTLPYQIYIDWRLVEHIPLANVARAATIEVRFK